MQTAVAMLREGTIGDVLVAKHVNSQKRGDIGHQKPSRPPEHLNYDLWVGPAPWREYRSNRCVTVRTADGRYQSIVYAPDFDCQSGGSQSGSSHSGSGWGNSGYHSGDRGVTLYRDLYLEGFSQTFTEDVPDMRRTRIGDDSATSVGISPGCTARLYQDLDFKGAYTEVTDDIGDLRSSRVGDDSVTSLQIRCGRHSGWGHNESSEWGKGDEWTDSGSRAYGVTLHRDLNYTGTSQTFTSDVPDLRGSRIGDDQATSVSVSRECRARLYQNPNYGGAYTEVTSDIGDLRGSSVGNDSVTSIRVRCD